MALVRCPECGAEVSDSANVCMGCGFPLRELAGNGHTPLDGGRAGGAPYVSPYLPVQETVNNFSIWQGFVNGWRKYAVCGGRARRKEFWGWIFFNAVFFTVVFFIGLCCFTDDSEAAMNGFSIIMFVVYGLVTAIPHTTIAVRRMHDTNRSGWNVFWWGWVPLVAGVSALCFELGWINGEQEDFSMVYVAGLICGSVLLSFCCMDSALGENRFGPNPKGMN